VFFFSSRRRHTRCSRDWSSDVCSSDLTSALHMERKLGLEPEEVVEQVRWSVAYAAGRVDEVQFSAEDATRSDPVFLARVCREAIAAGATTINLPDTVGYSLPAEHAEFLRQ